MKRSKHTLSNYRLSTFNMGKLVPVQCVPVLPGDSFQGHTELLIRVSPLNTPVMHPVQVRVHSFFVPNRIMWKARGYTGSWEDFITGGKDGVGPAHPTENFRGVKGELLNHLGCPVMTDPAPMNPFPVIGYNMIFNEWYRDQDLVAERSLTDAALANVAWEKDYFSTARPWTQRGPDVTLPIGDEAPVYTKQDSGTVRVQDAAKTGSRDLNQSGSGAGAPVVFGNSTGGENLFADLAQGTQININDFRAGFALQRYQEARARYGARFTEYLRYLGINSSDARLQRPEFLSGGTTRLNFSEVLQTSQNVDNATGSTGTGVGDLFGHGIAGTRTNKYRRFFEEHGWVYTLVSVRPKAIYTNGFEREWLKTTKEDYFQKELANLGQQEIDNRELFADSATGTFGYQDRYHEYRTQRSKITGDFLDTLNSWHLGREFATAPALNESFVKCDPSTRIYQVTNTDQLWVMANNHLVARRMVPKRANPRVL